MDLPYGPFAERAVAELPMGQSVDLMQAYGLRIAASVIGDMMGLDPALHTRLKRWADLITDVVTSVRPEEEDRKQMACEAMADSAALLHRAAGHGAGRSRVTTW